MGLGTLSLFWAAAMVVLTLGVILEVAHRIYKAVKKTYREH